MGSHDTFEYLKHKLWPKEGPGVKLAVWLLTTKSRELTQFPCVQVACDILLESFQWGLKLCFISIEGLHTKLLGPKVAGLPTLAISKLPTLAISRLPLGSLKIKSHLDGGLVERHIVYYKGEGGGFPQVWHHFPPSSDRGESCEFEFACDSS
jgi:hypothetical protein